MRSDHKTGGLGGEFRALAVGEAISTLGDQLAHLGVAVLVFGATGSATSAALAYAATFLPDLVAGPLLSPLADRFARRAVMVTCALVQAGFAALLAIPRLPSLVVILCVVAIAAASAPFKAAQAVTVNAVLPPGRQVTGQNRMSIIREAGQLAGIGAAAVVVTLVGTTTALIIDAVSFLLVALVLRVFLRARPAVRAAKVPGEVRAGLGWRLVWRAPPLRALNLVVLIGTFAILPDAVIIPLVSEMSTPSWLVGPLLAADVVGYLIGAKLLDLASERRQVVLAGPLLVVSLAPLIAFVVQPGPLLAVVLLLASGAGAVYLPVVRSMVLELAPEDARARVVGWLRTGLRAGQGLGVAAGGVLADLLASPARAIAIAGTAGTAAALVCLRTAGWAAAKQQYLESKC